MPRVSIQYFALLQDQRGRSEETLECAAPTLGALYDQLVRQHGFTLTKASLKVALNDEFSTWDAPLSEGDSVVFIPPVAGG